MRHKAWFVTAATLLLASAVTALPAEAASAPQFTGKQLASALLPPSYFGTGMSVAIASAADSGSHLEHGPAKYSLAKSSCTDFYNEAAGWGETAFALDSVEHKKETAWYTQAVYQFSSPTAAAAFFHGTDNALHRCSTAVFSGSITIRIKTQSISYGRVGSVPSITADLSAAITGRGPSALNRFHYLYVLVGSDVYEVIPSSTTTPDASVAVPAFNALRARVGRL
jgi:hypothetical protein